MLAGNLVRSALASDENAESAGLLALIKRLKGKGLL